MGCRSVPVRHLLDNYDAPWLGIPRRGSGSGRGAASNARQRLGQVETQRDQPPRPRCPTARAVNSNHRTGVQQSKGISPGPLNGRPAAGGAASNSNRRAGPGTESCVKSAWSGPRCLRRATSNPQRQHPSWGLWGERIIPTVNPGNRESCPQDFYGWKPWKIQTTQALSQAPGRKKTPCSTPPEIFPKLLTGTAASGPFTCATGPASGRATPTPRAFLIQPGPCQAVASGSPTPAAFSF